MSQDNLDVAKAAIHAFNEGNWEAAASSLAPHAVYDEVATQRRLEGVDTILAAWRGWKAAFSDNHGEIHDAYGSGDTVVLEITWRGKHDGTLATEAGDLPATGRDTATRACAVMRIGDGKIESFTHYFDIATLMAQLGAPTGVEA